MIGRSYQTVNIGVIYFVSKNTETPGIFQVVVLYPKKVTVTFHNCFPVSDGDSVAQNVVSLLSNPLPASEGEAKREVSHMCADLYMELFLNSLLFEGSAVAQW